MNRDVTVPIIVLLTGMLACAVPPGMTPTPVVVTQVVVVPNEQQQQVQASPTLPLPTVPPPSDTPISTATPSSTATTIVVPTATMSGPTITFIKDANCRNGPGTKYNVVTSYFKDQTLQIVGRNPDFNNTWWQINMPTGGKCWVSLATGQAQGDFDDIPIVKP